MDKNVKGRSSLGRRGFIVGSAGAVAGTVAALGAGDAALAEQGGDPGSSSLGAAAVGRDHAARGRDSRIGIGYETWFDAVGWARPEATPVLGHYRSTDPDVIRQHVRWLTWAGFDHLWVDWSNNLGANWTNGTGQGIMAGTDKLFEVLAGLHNPPQLYLLIGLDSGKAGTANFLAEVERIKSRYLADERYAKLYMHHDGKPLLTIYTGARTTPPPEWNDETFTVRWVGRSGRSSSIRAGPGAGSTASPMRTAR